MLTFLLYLAFTCNTTYNIEMCRTVEVIILYVWGIKHVFFLFALFFIFLIKVM
jgi:hypothetical protein